MSLTAFVACDKKGEEQEITADTKFEDIVSDRVNDNSLDELIVEADNVRNYRMKSWNIYNDYRIQSEIEFNDEKIKTTTSYEYIGDSDGEQDYKVYTYQYKSGDAYF